MFAYELLPCLTHLTLAGRDDDGELAFIGEHHQMQRARQAIADYEANL